MLAHSRGICWEAGGTQHGREDRGCQVWCLLPEPLDLGELRDRSGLSRALAASWHGVQNLPRAAQALPEPDESLHDAGARASPRAGQAGSGCATMRPHGADPQQAPALTRC